VKKLSKKQQRKRTKKLDRAWAAETRRRAKDRALGREYD
jgi:hypothetical protein